MKKSMKALFAFVVLFAAAALLLPAGFNANAAEETQISIDFTGLPQPDTGKASSSAVSAVDCPQCSVLDAYWTSPDHARMKDGDIFTRGWYVFNLDIALEKGYCTSPLEVSFDGDITEVYVNQPIVDANGRNVYRITKNVRLIETIDSIDLTGFVEPKAGASAVISSPLPDGVSGSAAWYEIDSFIDGEAVPCYSRFSGNMGYFFVAVLSPMQNCEFAEDVTVTINGRSDLIALSGIAENNALYVISSVYELRKPVDEIALTGVAMPEVGKKNSTRVVVPSGANYSVDFAGWYVPEEDRFMEMDEVFREGGEYCFYTELTTKYGYTFTSGELICTLNGNEYLVGDECEIIGANAYIISTPFKLSEPDDISRLAGESRQQTAVSISREAFPNGAENVVIASGDNYPDALVGVSLSYALDAPILLVRANTPDTDTLNEMKRLGAKNIYILGGTSVINAEVEKKLSEFGTVKRIAGQNRFETSAAVADMLFALKGEPEEIFFANAYNYPDALAISNVAALKGAPVFYIASDGSLAPSVEAYIKAHKISRATILGGTAAVSASAEQNIRKAGIASVSRISGDDRYDTCLQINETYADLFSGDAVCIATGTNYPDALSGGVFAAMKRAPMMLVGSALNDDQSFYLFDNAPTDIYVFGGTSAVSNVVTNQAVWYAIDCNETEFYQDSNEENDTQTSDNEMNLFADVLSN